ncbi:MAG: DUF1015 family protein [Planctomycetota bacterium]|jgi:uncharacterized protein (DUF1015 family)|nr:DUF1015 family protein [Planctomycetota bacterium]MDA1026048.1 DUF1015 family protein [Planctomycetota bacterium]
MSLIHPFKAIRPHPPHAADVSCPPYDVVSTEEARDLAQDRPNSYLHVIRPEIDFSVGVNPYGLEIYERARENLAGLIDSNILLEEDEPSLFVYRLVRGGHRQLGLACTVDAAEYASGRIRKHEKTRPDKEDDRTRHLDVSSVHAEAVFLAFRDDAPTANEICDALVAATTDRPLMHFVAGDVTHTLWRVLDPAIFETLFESVPDLYIADGHHRSAAGGRIAAERAAGNSAHSGDEEYNRILAVVFPQRELEILAYNRIVKDLAGQTPQAVLERLQAIGSVEPLPDGADPTPNEPGTLSIRLDGGWLRFTFPPDSIDRDDPIASLDVSLLQTRILEPLLGIGDPRLDKRIGFVGGIRGNAELERLTNQGDWAIAFSMHPTSMDELLRAADAGEIMPPKSTWFEPKLRSGLFAHRFETTKDFPR